MVAAMKNAKIQSNLPASLFISHFLKKIFIKDFIYLFILDTGEGRQKDRERNINAWLPLTHPILGTRPATQACALTGNPTSDPLVHRLALNPLSHTRQGSSSNLMNTARV